MLHPSLNNSPLAAARLREHRAFLIPQFERESWRGDFALKHFPKDFELRLPASEKEEKETNWSQRTSQPLCKCIIIQCINIECINAYSASFAFNYVKTTWILFEFHIYVLHCESQFVMHWIRISTFLPSTVLANPSIHPSTSASVYRSISKYRTEWTHLRECTPNHKSDYNWKWHPPNKKIWYSKITI